MKAIAANASGFHPEFANPLAVSFLQEQIRKLADRYAEAIEHNAELMIRLGGRNG